MTKNELKKFLSDSFGEGVYFRELRLSTEEIKVLRELYPHATVRRTTEVSDANSKAWYEINLLPRKVEGTETIQEENRRLKQEIEVLKKGMN
ncbi:hypothetical protein [Halobacillus sp. BBL2006]|uniref:hypothetical protein n=1 Tax=Halobacillus sp. BBL2006 TaxID=1543706 RepID=UPI000542270A|nr:hypothetical protein [Halobacillus sp. BBL2006]KHE71598.1 hypothetical protein LD39_08985 [Halobacillus sp. BBL2006]